MADMDKDPDYLRDAIAYMCDIRFHKSFLLSANVAHGRPKPIRVSYADMDHRANKDSEGQEDTGPTLIFIGGAGCSRWVAIREFDTLASFNNLRLISVDNFGMGGTERIPVKHRAASYVDLIRELLACLGIRHTAIATHSAGAVYLLNILLELRYVLHPVNPMVFVSAPWILPKHSRSKWPSAARFVPKQLLTKSYWFGEYVYDFANGCLRTLRKLRRSRKRRRASVREQAEASDEILPEPLPGDVPKFPNADCVAVHNTSRRRLSAPASEHADQESARRSSLVSNVVPSLSIVSSMSHPRPYAPSIASTHSRPPAAEHENPTTADEPAGHQSPATSSESVHSIPLPPWSSTLATKWRRLENLVGAGDEVLFCLQRGRGVSWGRFGDLDKAIDLLAAQERVLREERGLDEGQQRLRVDVAFAGKDRLVGKDGAAWFRKLWEGQEDWADFLAWTDEECSHNEVLGFNGNLDAFMEDVARFWNPGNGGREGDMFAESRGLHVPEPPHRPASI